MLPCMLNRGNRAMMQDGACAAGTLYPNGFVAEFKLPHCSEDQAQKNRGGA